MMKHYFNTNKVLSVTALAIGAITIFFACKKDDKAGADEARDTQTIAVTQKEVEINAVYEDACVVVLNANFSEETLNSGARKAPASNSFFAKCLPEGIDITPATIGVFPKTVTLDFGTGCTDTDINRKGKINIVIDKLFFSTGAKATITFDNYYVNGIKVEGTQILTNLSTVGGFAYEYTVTEGKLTYPNGSVYQYGGTRTLTQTAGADTPIDLGDDTYELTGNATLKDSTSLAAVKIDSALVRKLSCAYIGKGVLTVTVNSHAAKVNYGNGDCDNKALLTVGDKTKEITLWK
jgi:hypothetical protein